MVGKDDLWQILDLLYAGMSNPEQVSGSPRPGLVCADGFEMSVQAGRYFYCKPRRFGQTLKSEEYDAWEIGYPGEPEELLLEYAEDPDDLTETVYGYVPAEVVMQVFQKHGGLHPSLLIKLQKQQRLQEVK